jgi:hypothetical protein
VLSVAAEDPTSIIDGQPALNFAGTVLFDLPGFTYNDNTGTVSITQPTYTFGNQMTISDDLFANVIESHAITGSGIMAAHTITETFTLNSVLPSSPSHLPLTITTNVPTNQSVSGIYTSAPTCQITRSNGTCNITINSASGMPLTSYSYNYTISPYGSNYGILQNFSFILP